MKKEKRKKSKLCTGRESNPGLPRGRREFYAYLQEASDLNSADIYDRHIQK